MFDVDSYAFKGPAYYDGTKYQKLKIDDEDTALDRDISRGWVAACSTISSPRSCRRRARLALQAQVQGNEYLLARPGPAADVAPGASATLKETLFVGPKLQAQLAAGPRLDLVADYGMLTVLARPLFWLLRRCTAGAQLGFTIIIVTFLLKLVFYPLSEAAANRWRRWTLAPRMKSLQERYKDDREKLGQAMMELYKQEKINPLAGCLPILVQIPVFFAFYWVLLESVEMRQAPFFGWIQDLSSRIRSSCCRSSWPARCSCSTS